MYQQFFSQNVVCVRVAAQQSCLGWATCLATGEKGFTEIAVLQVSVIQRPLYLYSSISSKQSAKSIAQFFCSVYYTLREQDYCDKLPSVIGEYHCQVKSHKTISIVWTHRKAPGMKISDQLLALADICLCISDCRNIGKNLYQCNKKLHELKIEEFVKRQKQREVKNWQSTVN